MAGRGSRPADVVEDDGVCFDAAGRPIHEHDVDSEPALRLAVEASAGGKILTPSEIGLTTRQADVLALDSFVGPKT